LQYNLENKLIKYREWLKKLVTAWETTINYILFCILQKKECPTGL